MRWLDRLERRYGDAIAIPNLMYYVILLNGITYLVGHYVNPRIFGLMALDPQLLLQYGQWWRALTFVFIPPQTSIIFIFFVLYFYWMMGGALEAEWGAFRFTMFYLIGMVSSLIVALVLFGLGAHIVVDGTFLNLSILLAFATLFPDFEILLFFILPLKMRYVAWLSLAFFAFSVLTWPLAGKAMALVALANYLLFFGKDFLRDLGLRQRQVANRNRFYARMHNEETQTVHRCTTCEQTEADDKTLEFRYCSCPGCNGEKEYCMAHLKEHKAQL